MAFCEAAVSTAALPEILCSHPSYSPHDATPDALSLYGSQRVSVRRPCRPFAKKVVDYPTGLVVLNECPKVRRVGRATPRPTSRPTDSNRPYRRLKSAGEVADKRLVGRLRLFNITTTPTRLPAAWTRKRSDFSR